MWSNLFTIYVCEVKYTITAMHIHKPLCTLRYFLKNSIYTKYNQLLNVTQDFYYVIFHTIWRKTGIWASEIYSFRVLFHCVERDNSNSIILLTPRDPLFQHGWRKFALNFLRKSTPTWIHGDLCECVVFEIFGRKLYLGVRCHLMYLL